MKVKDTEECIIISRESEDSEESFVNAFKTSIVTLMLDRETKKIKGIKIWKTKSVLNRIKPIKGEKIKL